MRPTTTVRVLGTSYVKRKHPTRNECTRFVTTATLIGTVSGRGATLLQQWPAGLAAAVAARGEDTSGRTSAMTVHELTAASAAGTMPLHHLGRSRFMITDILSDNGRNNGGGGSPVSPASSTDGPRDLSLHGRASSGSNGGGHGVGPAGGGGPADSDLSDDHESGTDSGLPGDNSSVCSNGKSSSYVFSFDKSEDSYFNKIYVQTTISDYQQFFSIPGRVENLFFAYLKKIKEIADFRGSRLFSFVSIIVLHVYIQYCTYDSSDLLIVLKIIF